MSRKSAMSRVLLAGMLLLVALIFTACYKDAGENVAPTSRQVTIGDITPTTPAPPTQASTATPSDALLATPTRGLVPTTTPSDAVQSELPATVTPREGDLAEMPATPTDLPMFQPSFTPLGALGAPGTPSEAATRTTITTPIMSDIRPSPTPSPTIDPSKMPTPTDIPIELNPCIHVVTFGDTLYSIARDNEVTLEALVAANPTLLGGNPNAILQVGWQLRLPGCEEEGAETPVVEETPAVAAPGETPSGPVVHVVQAGEGIYSIARKYGVTYEAIVAANNLANPNLIYPGQELIIPLGQ
ncbi:MAG: LysM peptidoglycan-binding domain-containing protein [Anaerolineae bacterium]|nr:LysM peptidoglycan-binding domain-containing protein [Anaerolineae bacterium]